MNHENDRLPGDLQDIADRLVAERPEATPLELDRMRSRVRTGRQPSPGLFGVKGILLRSRMALTMMLVLGVMVSGAGGALALSGSSSSGNAARSQYCPPASANGQGGQNSNSQSDTGRRCGQRTGVGTLGDGGGPGDAQATRQSAGNKKLPFTGYGAIPVIIVGLGLVIVGVTLRRQAGRLRTEQ
jgi:hypothetical protein